MIIREYHRPETLEKALELIRQSGSIVAPVGGGSALRKSPYVNAETAGVIALDLQSLGLDQIDVVGSSLVLGATLTLQRLLDALKGDRQGLDGISAGLGHGLASAIEHEAAYNLRQVGTVAGTFVVADGRSPFAVVLLALDAALSVAPGPETLTVGDVLPLRKDKLQSRLITQITVPNNINLKYEQVARSPYDRPIVCAATATWPSGRVRVALGGFGSSPSLAFDGTEAQGAETAARSAFSYAGDEWASAEYRQEVAEVLVKRMLAL